MSEYVKERDEKLRKCFVDELKEFAKKHETLNRAIIDLIERQQAEIKGLKAELKKIRDEESEEDYK